nr:MAG TPA: hypothetical protein [Caudoviricetes sp.]
MSWYAMSAVGSARTPSFSSSALSVSSSTQSRAASSSSPRSMWMLIGSLGSLFPISQERMAPSLTSRRIPRSARERPRASLRHLSPAGVRGSMVMCCPFVRGGPSWKSAWATHVAQSAFLAVSHSPMISQSRSYPGHCFSVRVRRRSPSLPRTIRYPSPLMNVTDALPTRKRPRRIALNRSAQAVQAKLLWKCPRASVRWMFSESQLVRKFVVMICLLLRGSGGLSLPMH